MVFPGMMQKEPSLISKGKANYLEKQRRNQLWLAAQLNLLNDQEQEISTYSLLDSMCLWVLIFNSVTGISP